MTTTIGDHFLTYVQHFDIVPQVNATQPFTGGPKGLFPEPSTGLHMLKRSKRSNGKILGDVVPLDRVCALVDLVPCFGDKADTGLTKENSLTYSREFWLNKYFDKELFLALN